MKTTRVTVISHRGNWSRRIFLHKSPKTQSARRLDWLSVLANAHMNWKSTKPRRITREERSPSCTKL